MNKSDFVRGRVFGIKNNVRKAVVISYEGEAVTWSFLNRHENGFDKVSDIVKHCDWVGDIDYDFLKEVEEMKCPGGKL